MTRWNRARSLPMYEAMTYDGPLPMPDGAYLDLFFGDWLERDEAREEIPVTFHEARPWRPNRKRPPIRHIRPRMGGTHRD